MRTITGMYREGKNPKSTHSVPKKVPLEVPRKVPSLKSSPLDSAYADLTNGQRMGTVLGPVRVQNGFGSRLPVWTSNWGDLQRVWFR
jgi:hypothetical protein